MNPMGTAEIPAKLISEQLRQLETAPAYCAGLSVLAIVLLLPIVIFILNNGVNHPVLACVAMSILACLTGVAITAGQFKTSCREHPRWQRALWQYWRAAVGLVFLVLIAPVLSGVLISTGIMRAWSVTTVWLLSWILPIVVLSVVGPRTHRRLKKILHPLQRDVAVQIARDTPRKKLHKGGRGRFG